MTRLATPTPDYLVVGTGLTGATIARVLADGGARVRVVERRTRVAGHVHDRRHWSGIWMHSHGPHYFRTSSEAVWQFVGRFARFRPWEARVLTRVDDQCVPWPLGVSTIRRLVGDGWAPELHQRPGDFEQAAMGLMPRVVYERFVREYTEKQWGVPAAQLSADLCRRFDVREDDDPRLTPKARYQGLPEGGYAAMVAAMLRGIPVELGCNYLKHRAQLRVQRGVIFSGPIDAFFDYRFGRLHYRAQRREHEYRTAPGGFVLPGPQVNNPRHAAGPHIRTIEWKHLLPQHEADRISGTVLTRETPYSPRDAAEFEYPMPDNENRKLYARYRALAARLDDVVICGRLGDYRYYDMDHAIGRALAIGRELLENGPSAAGRRFPSHRSPARLSPIQRAA